MKITITLGKSLQKIRAFADVLQKEMPKEIMKNAHKACEAMEAEAKAHTPHANDGKTRGKNVISNSLMESWKATCVPSRTDTKIGKVILTNNKKYAQFVQSGHRVKRHFVPWLYKDASGTISYETNHSQPLFGLIVGTKTTYVDGVNMIGPAVEAFNKTFDKLNRGLLKSFGVML